MAEARAVEAKAVQHLQPPCCGLMGSLLGRLPSRFRPCRGDGGEVLDSFEVLEPLRAPRPDSQTPQSQATTAGSCRSQSSYSGSGSSRPSSAAPPSSDGGGSRSPYCGRRRRGGGVDLLATATRRAPPLQSGLQDHYRLGDALGEGAFGSVCKATCKLTGKHVAVKTIPAKDDKSNADVESEIAAMRDLEHPHVVRLHCSFKEEEAYHLVMELCAGGDLMSFVDRFVSVHRAYHRSDYDSGLSAQLAAGYAWQMLDGLAFLHDRGLIHRDIKPENYLLQSTGVAPPLKLTDFGFACRIGPAETLSRRVGTDFFAAPEVLAGAYDQRADVWSLGVTCFVICANQMPFEGHTLQDYEASARAGARREAAVPWEQHLPQLRELVAEMLQPDWQARPRPKDLLDRNPWLHSYGQQQAGGGCVIA